MDIPVTSANGSLCRVRLVFAHDGAFHAEIVTLPADRLDQYDRLVDMLREEPSVTRHLYVDMRKLVSASLLEGGAEAGGNSREVTETVD